jgi:4-alpha-glucanotransferase
MLPLGPTTQCDSPYSCYSAFAGNPLLISPEDLVSDGILTHDDLATIHVNGQAAATQANYPFATSSKTALLKRAFDRFRDSSSCSALDDFEAYCTQNRWWLDDFSLFAALMKHLGTDHWPSWPEGLVRRDSRVMGEYRSQLAREVEFEQFVQYLFSRQWQGLKTYANERGVQLFGDMPIFVAHGSADVWANQSIFALQETGEPKLIAGVPPDYFSKTGQLWGNPLYDWEHLAETNYEWWTKRLRVAFEYFDLLRIDHFRGFEAYWEVPYGAKTAVSGRWVKGPGTLPFDAARAELGHLPIIAEDLGLITDEVHALREALAFPGMRVLQFGFDSHDDFFHRPETYPEDSVAYTGTHDNSTIVGWMNERKNRQDDPLRNYLEPPSATQMPYHWQLISMVMRSRSQLAIVPMQDVLGLDDSARMNVPGLATGNWGWRLGPDGFSAEAAERLKLLTIASDR